MTRRVDNPEAEWSLAAKYRLFDRVITISHAIRKVLIRQGVDPEKLTCVHSALDPGPYSMPCDPSFFKGEFGGDGEGPSVGMAAQFIPRKGHDVLLEAIPGILRDHPGARFLLFGKGPLHGEIAAKVRDAGLEDSVTLPGFRDDLPAILPCLDLLVHPAFMEGLGVVLLQAAASGVPVVASAVGGIPEAVIHDRTGLLVPPGNAAALASAVSALLADPEKARNLGEQGRERVGSHFSVERMVEGNLQVYRELLFESAEV
jgi:glycosyltransferase involved in cell wall biosynthesis